MFHKLLKSFFRSITSNKRGAVLVVLIFAVLLIAPTSIAYGQELEPSIGGGDDGWFASGIAKLIYYLTIPILSWILAAVGTLADYMTQPIQITTSNTVQMGWSITRDFANMFFILILLGIALDYILMGVSFGVKKALPTFIAVALLINFSLPIAGVFIDFSNILTSFFLKEIGGGNFSLVFANLLGLSNVFNAQNVQQAQNATQVGFSTITDVLFADFFLIGTIFVLLSLSVMFLIRTGMLMGLLVVLPLVLVVMPFNRSYWGKWSGKFMQYIMFGPAAMFFLYLSMKIFEGNVMANMGASLSVAQGKRGFLDQIVQYLVVWFFMGGSLVAANSFGVHGSGAALKMFKQGEGWVKGKIKSGAIKAGKMGAGEVGRRVGASEKMDKAAEMASKIPLFGGSIARGIRGVAVKTSQAIKQQGELSKEQKERYEKMSASQRMAEYQDLAKSKVPFDQSKAAQLASMMAQKGELTVRNKETGEIDSEKSDTLVREAHDLAKKYKIISAQQSIRLSRPTVAADIITEEWEKNDREGKVHGAEYDPETNRISAGRNRETGKTFEEAKRAMFDMKMSDFENMKGSWTKESVKSFIETGALHSGFIKRATDIGDGDFLRHIEEYLEDIANMNGENRNTMLDNLRKKNPSFYSFATKSGNAADYIIVPGSIKSHKERGQREQEARTQTHPPPPSSPPPPLGV